VLRPIETVYIRLTIVVVHLFPSNEGCKIFEVSAQTQATSFRTSLSLTIVPRRVVKSAECSPLGRLERLLTHYSSRRTPVLVGAAVVVLAVGTERVGSNNAEWHHQIGCMSVRCCQVGRLPWMSRRKSGSLAGPRSSRGLNPIKPLLFLALIARRLVKLRVCTGNYG